MFYDWLKVRISVATKGVTYDERPKMKRDARLKAVLFLGKKTAFSRTSLFIFGRPLYVAALLLAGKLAYS